MGNKHNISRDILIRYLNGELPDEEAWKVEKAMQEDPFLAEAMEGLELARQKGGFSEDLEELERKINIREKENVTTVRVPFLRIAAVILVLAISIVGIYELFNRNPAGQSELAMQKNEEKKDTAGTATYNDAGTAKQEQQPIATQPQSPQDKIAESKSSPREEKSDESTVVHAFDEAKPAAPVNEPTEEVAVGNVEEDESQARGNGLARSAAPVMTDTTQPVEITPDVTAATELPSSVSRDRAAGAMKKESKYQSDRKAKSQPYESADEMFIATSGQSYPVPGDSAYRIYLKKNLDYPAAARQHGIEGDVTVGFTVKPDSTLSNFKIIDGIGSGCDEEAIRLLKQGPGWVPRISNGKPVSSEVIYKVPFRLNP